MVLDKTLESPLDCKDIKPVHPKGNQSWIFIGKTNAEAEAPVLWPPDVKSWLTGKDPDAGKDWRREKGMTEREMVGWHHRLDGHEFEQALWVGEGQGGLVCCSPWGRKESDTTERQNENSDALNIRIHVNFLSFLFLLFILYCSSFSWTVKGLSHTYTYIYTTTTTPPPPRQTLLPSRLPHDIEQSSLCWPAGPCWFSMLNPAVCPCPSQTPWLSLPPSFPLVTIRLLQSVKQTSLCCAVGHYSFSMLTIALSTCSDIHLCIDVWPSVRTISVIKQKTLEERNEWPPTF